MIWGKIFSSGTISKTEKTKKEKKVLFGRAGIK
jgi:hypothetical protein